MERAISLKSAPTRLRGPARRTRAGSFGSVCPRSGKPSKRAFMRKTTMGDLIGNAKEFAKEMEQYLQLQRAADKAKRDADA